jgi:RimJ/RimL family protein N-acetyltransferase
MRATVMVAAVVLSLHLLWCLWVLLGWKITFGLTRLGVFVHPENVASIRVLEKVGFKRERRETVFGMDPVVF